MAFTMVKITTDFVKGDGSWADGALTATPIIPMKNEDTVIDAPVRGVIIDGSVYLREGELATPVTDMDPFVLAATDDPGTSPTGSFYKFRVSLLGKNSYEFLAEIPNSLSEVLISSLTPLVNPPAPEFALTIPNASSEPLTPVSGGVLFAEGGALKYKGSSGTVTTIGPA